MPTFFILYLINFGGEIISKSFDKKVDVLVNEDITAEQVLVISETGEKLGSMHSKDALRLADERGYDLVCVAPNATVPVCKLMDYSKYRYDQIKKAREAKKNQKVVTVKEVRLSPTIDTGDLMTKQKATRRFLTDGDKVKVSCRFRGRMIEYANKTKEVFLKFAADLSDVANVEQQPTLDGRNMFMQLGPIPEKKKN